MKSTTIELQGLMDLLAPTVQDSIINNLDKIPEKEKFEKLFEQINDLTSKEGVDTILESARITNAMDSLSGAASNLNSFINTSKKTLKITIASGMLYFGFQYYRNRKTQDLVFLATISVIAVITIGSDDFQALYGAFVAPLLMMFAGNTKEENDDNVELQSGISTVLYDSMILSWLGYIGFKEDEEFKFKGKLREFSDLLRLRSTLPEFIDSILEFLTKLYNNFIASRFKGTRIHFNSFDDPILKDFDQEVEEMISAKARGDFSMTMNNRAKVEALLIKAKDLYRSIPTTKDYNNQRTLFGKTVESITKVKREFDHANVHLNGFRPEAVGVLFRGGAGSHKSTIMNSLSGSLAAAVLSKEDYADYSTNQTAYEHNRQHETVYMDGYSPKTITVFFDDLGQSRDAAGNPDSEWMNIIRFINSFECMGHAAAMDLKGELRIRPKFVLATTNQMRLKSNSINCIDAVNRRFVINVIAAPKAQYCVPGFSGLHDRRFDYSTLPQVVSGDSTTSDIRMEFFEFYPCDQGGEVCGVPYGYDTLVSNTVREYRKREVWAEKHLSNFKMEADKVRRELHPEEFVETQSLLNLFKTPDLQEDEDEVVPMWAMVHTIKESQDILDLAHSLDLRVEDEGRAMLAAVGSILPCVSQDTIDKLNGFFDRYKTFNPYELGNCLREIIDDADITWHLSGDDLLLLMYQHDAENFKRFILGTKHSRYANDYSLDKDVFRVSAHVEVTQVYSFRDLMFEYAHKACDGMRYMYQWLKEIDKSVILKFTAVVTTVTVLYKMFNSRGEDLSEAQTDYGIFKSKNAKHANKSLQMMKQQMRAGVPSNITQAFDISGEQVIKSLDKSNVVTVKMEVAPGDFKMLGYGIILKKNRILIPLHFVHTVVEAIAQDPELSTNTVLFVPPTNEDNQIVWGRCSLFEFVDKSYGDGFEDYHVAVLDVNTRDCKDITKKSFINESSINTYMNMFDVTVSMPARNFMASSRAYKTSLEVKGPNGEFYHMKHVVRYFADTNAGDCGAPLYIRRSRLQGHRILGFHVAGSRNSEDECAFSTIVTQELLDSLLETVPNEKKIIDEVMLDEVETQSVPICISSKYRVLGKVNQNHSPYGITDIRPSPINKLKNKDDAAIVSRQLPALLREKDGIDPYANALSKYCVNESIVDQKILMCAKEDFQGMLFSQFNKTPKTLLSYEESLWGSCEEEHLEAIKSSSSPGFPIKYDKGNLKASLFEINGMRSSTHPRFEELTRACEGVVQDASNGVRRLWVMTDNLKSERRTIEKVLSGSTRLFNGSPFIYLVVFRRYFGRFAQFVHLNSVSHGMVTTINPYSRRWDEIAQAVKSRSDGRDPPVCDGDFSKFDGSMLTDFAWAILQIINEWYDDGNDRIREVLWLEVVNSRHIVNNVIYEWFGSLPSGNPLTLIINCMNNQLIHRYCFYKAFGFNLKFDDHVTLFVTGDDLLMAVSNSFKELFNGVTVKDMMLEIGYVYTSSDKTSDVVKFKKLSEVSFLKRSFRYEKARNRYIACLDITSVREIPLWSKKGDYLAVASSNVEDFLNELSLHDIDTWKKYHKQYASAIELFMPDSEVISSLHMTKRRRMDIVLGETE